VRRTERLRGAIALSNATRGAQARELNDHAHRRLTFPCCIAHASERWSS
jgi:hypothetical protein